MRWLEDPPLPAADLAAIEVPVLILAGELDQVSGVSLSKRIERTADRGPVPLLFLSWQVSPLSAAEEWRDALTGGK